jgi:hypothetical protein
MTSIEQRRHPRINVDFFADWGWGPECEFYDRVTSLSVSGCFLNTKRELIAGQEIYLRWTEEIAGAISLKGAVRYQQRVMEGAPPTGAGVEFLHLSAEGEKKLQAVLDRNR